MGDLWRSEPMDMVQFYIPRDAAHEIFDELGEVGCVQFLDLNKEVALYQRTYVNEVTRCNDLERILRYIQTQIEIEEKGLKVGQTLLSISGIANEIVKDQKRDIHGRVVFEMNDLESDMQQLEADLHEASRNYDAVLADYEILLEQMHVYEKDNTFFNAGNDSGDDVDIVGTDDGSFSTPGGNAFKNDDLKVGFITGVVPREKENLFERVMWRALRGNLFYRCALIDEPEFVDHATGELIEKAVFVVFFHGANAFTKARKICDAFGAHVVNIPQSNERRLSELVALQQRISDMRILLNHAKQQRLQMIARASMMINDWFAYVRREKAIYTTMNLCSFDAGRSSLIANGWMPKRHNLDVTNALKKAAKKVGGNSCVMTIVNSKETPPTYFKVNKYTECFNSMIESYGFAVYGEVNPAAVSVITFPFLFAIMFGDGGHGFLLLLCAIAMCCIYPKVRGKPMNEIFDMLLYGRYLILLMGIFSLYTGAIYNDFFSIPLTIFDSPYHAKGDENKTCEFGDQCVKSNTSSYPFGVDPIWRRSENDLFLYNSMKMKLSIVFGVVQMMVGIIFSCCNHVHFKKPLNIIFDFIPQVLFLSCTFGYMVFLIFFKWLSPTITPSCSYIINIVIDMYVNFNSPQKGEELFPYQNKIQDVLVVITLLSALAMIFPKPIIQAMMNKRQRKVTRIAAIKKNLRKKVSVVSDLKSINADDIQRPLLAEEVDVASDRDGDEVDDDAEDDDFFGTAIFDDYSNNQAGASTGAKVFVNTTSSSTTITTTVPEHVVKEAMNEAGGSGEEEEGFVDLFITQAIHSIEFILGCVSNTASYLRLWALSLAHAQLSSVFYEQLIMRGLTLVNFWGKSIVIFVAYGAWGGITIAILLCMEALSAFLHGLRLHWVEFMNKFYMGEGYQFVPFSFERILGQADSGSYDE